MVGTGGYRIGGRNSGRKVGGGKGGGGGGEEEGNYKIGKQDNIMPWVGKCIN